MKLSNILGMPSNKLPLSVKISHKEENIVNILSGYLDSYLQALPLYKPIVFLCVGTDRSTGDSLGPLVGSKLAELNKDLYLYGTLEEPVHAMNLNDTLTSIYQKHKEPFVIAVDACLGQLTSVGCIQLGDGPIKPGAGVNKDLPPVGNIHVTGIVNVGGFMEYFVLQNTRLSLVMNMADVIVKAFCQSLLNLQRSEPAPLVKID